jgi:energy-coupling factor transporter ATP-binding protein EcfA2/GNAT superfamily N-acetyltransferase
MATIELKNKIINDKYTNYVYEAFDIQDNQETKVSIPMNMRECKTFDWNIGVIYGGSGAGKTTILKQMGEIKQVEFDGQKPLISNFDWLEPEEATFLLTAMGLSSVPTWLRPFHTLSNGEQYRASLAYLVGKAKDNEVILVDEYTSVVDRDVAKAMSFALQKYIRKYNKKIILASCHFDIMEWLLPDWTYSPFKGRVERHDCLRQSRPKIDLQIFRCRYETWNLFKSHHYLSEDLNKASKCFLVTWNNKPVAFFAFLTLPSGAVKNAWRGTRSVVLPDFQGLGIGNKVAKYLHSLFKKEGIKMYVKSSNPAIVNSRLNDIDYKGGLVSKATDNSNRNWKVKTNKCWSFEYIGKPSTDDSSIIIFSIDAYRDVAQNQIELF